MIKFSRRNSLPGLLFATALPLAPLAEGAAPAVAGSVSVTGANGANGSKRHLWKWGRRRWWGRDGDSDDRDVSEQRIEHCNGDRRHRRRGGQVFQILLA
jgi:hypothetical protein